ncbi:hypothetical protein AWC38_SpisGene3066 [Stylophora pistillata]|uniref:Uncharacterized protein n=1 Tax=Stylophora pistillata TaxID=50429 RepID=A0A2B4SQE3_STYPI|nr:hypothetical protein AWC38_SpisGene3066 [Stylophora pistillata]
MTTTTVLTISFVFFLVLASLCRTSQGFALSLTARRDELKKSKRKQVSDGVRLRRKLKRLKDKELELERKVSELSKRNTADFLEQILGEIYEDDVHSCEELKNRVPAQERSG